MWFANRHYEAAEYDGVTMCKRGHAFVQHLQQLCTTHPPPTFKEDDIDQSIMANRCLPQGVPVSTG